jgi:hypothetical protein
MEKKYHDDLPMKKEKIAEWNHVRADSVSANDMKWNKKTIEAMKETDRLLADPDTKYYNVDDALIELKR